MFLPLNSGVVGLWREEQWKLWLKRYAPWVKASLEHTLASYILRDLALSSCDVNSSLIELPDS